MNSMAVELPIKSPPLMSSRSSEMINSVTFYQCSQDLEPVRGEKGGPVRSNYILVRVHTTDNMASHSKVER